MKLDVAGRNVVVVGGDARAAAQVAALLGEGAHVSVVAPTVTPAIEDLALRGLVTWHAREVQAHDLDADLVLTVRASPPSTHHSRAGASVTLVGAGPGDPGLMTLAGREALEQADVVVTDRLVPLAALGWTRPDAEIVDVAKLPGGRATTQEQINRLLVAHALAGRSVVRLKGGDGFVLGRGGEELMACAEAGLAVRVIPGVTSATAVPALAGIPVTHRGLAQGFTVISGHVPPGHAESTMDYKALAATGTTIVVLMGVRTLPAITAAILDAGLDPTCPAAVVADGSLPSQRVIVGTLATIAADAMAAQVKAPAITVIGPVAGLLRSG